MNIGKYELKKKKPFTPRGYLLVYTMEKNQGDKFISCNYVFNKESCLMERKKVLDASFLSSENIFTSFNEVQKCISENILKVKSLGKFLSSGCVHSISYVESEIVEKEDQYLIKVNSIPCVWNKKDKILVPIIEGD